MIIMSIIVAILSCLYANFNIYIKNQNQMKSKKHIKIAAGVTSCSF